MKKAINSQHSKYTVSLHNNLHKCLKMLIVLYIFGRVVSSPVESRAASAASRLCIGIGISWVSVLVSHLRRYWYLMPIGIGISWVSVSVSHGYRYRYLIGIDIGISSVSFTSDLGIDIRSRYRYRYRYLMGIGIGISLVSVLVSHGYRYRHLMGIGIGISLVSV